MGFTTLKRNYFTIAELIPNQWIQKIWEYKDHQRPTTRLTVHKTIEVLLTDAAWVRGSTQCHVTEAVAQQAFISDDMESSSALSAGRIWGLGSSHAHMSFSRCQISGRHSLYCRSGDIPTASGLWEEAAPLCTWIPSEELLFKNKRGGIETLNLVSLSSERRFFRCETTERRTGRNTALCRSDSRHSGCNKCTARCWPAGVSLWQLYTRAKTTIIGIWLQRGMIPVFVKTYHRFTAWLKKRHNAGNVACYKRNSTDFYYELPCHELPYHVGFVYCESFRTLAWATNSELMLCCNVTHTTERKPLSSFFLLSISTIDIKLI